MIKKHWTVYKAFDKSIHFKGYLLELVGFYNFKNNTNYKYISEFAHNLFENKTPVADIAKALEITKVAAYALLGRMNIRVSKSVKSIAICDLSPEDLINIRASKKKQRSIAIDYGVSTGTISNIITRQGRYSRL